jgi:hypothetical protein
MKQFWRFGDFELEPYGDTYDISIPIRFNGKGTNAFHSSSQYATSLCSTTKGDSVNCDSISYTPHCSTFKAKF